MPVRAVPNGHFCPVGALMAFGMSGRLRLELLPSVPGGRRAPQRRPGWR